MLSCLWGCRSPPAVWQGSQREEAQPSKKSLISDIIMSVACACGFKSLQVKGS